MFKKLRRKVLFLNMAVTTGVLLIAFGAVYLTTLGNTDNENQKKLDNVTGSFLHSVPNTSGNPAETPGDPAQGQTITSNNMVTSDYAPSFIITVDDNGNVIKVDSFIDMPETVYNEAAQTAWNKDKPSTLVFSGRSWVYQITPCVVTQQAANGTITQETVPGHYQIVFLDITDSLNTLRNLLMTFLFVGIIMLVVIFFISLYFAKRSIEPVREAWEKQKQFVADASHELKTPLTTIMTNFDVLEANENETIKSQKEWLGYIRIGTNRMNKLVNNLLSLARVEGMEVQADKRLFSISALVSDVMQSMSAAAQAKDLSVDRKIEIDKEILGYDESVRQVFTILYENAVKYADESGKIDVCVRRNKKGVICAVRNTGNGIPEKDLPHIFDRFYRSDMARSNDENSYGLGLPIAKGIAEQIDGKITVKSIERKWTEFILIFEA